MIADLSRRPAELQFGRALSGAETLRLPYGGPTGAGGLQFGRALSGAETTANSTRPTTG